MKRRPHIPLKVRLEVALRQLGYDDILRASCLLAYRNKLATLLKGLLDRIRIELGEQVLRLDHNPALGLREYSPRTGRWTPDANDPEYLIYRGYEDHQRKTYIRGDGAQFSDTTEMKRRRRRAKKAKGVRPLKRRVGSGQKSKVWPSRPFPRGRGFAVKRSRRP